MSGSAVNTGLALGDILLRQTGQGIVLALPWPHVAVNAVGTSYGVRVMKPRSFMAQIRLP